MSAQDYNDLFSEPFHKHLTLLIGTNPQTTYTNEDILQESLSIEDSLCSEDNLRFGRCECRCLKVSVANKGVSLKDKFVQVMMTGDIPDRLVDSNSNHIVNHEDDYIAVSTDSNTVFPMSGYIVVEETVSNDRSWRQLTCYDLMYEILNMDVASWYNSLTFPMTINNFRNSFFTRYGIPQETTTLINDSLIIQGGFTSDGVISGKTIIEAICELNGVFGHVSNTATFEYIDLTSAENVELSHYVDGTGTYEDYETDEITGIIVRDNENDVGTAVGSMTNPYVIENNPLTYGLEGSTNLRNALTALLNKISQITFRPFEVQTYGNPMLKLGTAIYINTRDQTIESYVINKTMTGIQALRDSLSAKSDKTQPSTVNSVQSQINRTSGKVHDIVISVDELSSEITSVSKLTNRGMKVYECTSYSSYYPTQDPDDMRYRLNVPIATDEFEPLGASQECYIGIMLPSDMPDDGYKDLKITIGTTEIIAPIEYNSSALVDQISGYEGYILYLKLSTDASTNYTADVLTDTTARSLIQQTDSSITAMVEEVNSVNIPVLEMDSYTDDAQNTTTTINVSVDSLETMLKLIVQPSRFGIKLNAMTATQKTYKKYVNVNHTSGSGSIQIQGWIRKDDNSIATNEFADGEILYLEYDERTVSGTDVDDFWIVTDSYSRAQLEITNNQIVMKVDSNGNIGKAAIGVDPDTTLTAFEIDVDSIKFKANSTMDLSAAQLSITSTNFTVDTSGNVVAKNFTVTPSSAQHGSFKIKDSLDNVLGSWGGNYQYSGVTFHQLTPTRKEASYFISNAEFIAQNIFSDGSGDVTGGFTEYMKWGTFGLYFKLMVDPFAQNEEDRTASLNILGDVGSVDIYNYGKDRWGTGVTSLRGTIQDMFKTQTLSKVVSISNGASTAIYFSASEWQMDYFSCVGLVAYNADFACVCQVRIDYDSSHQIMIQLYNVSAGAISNKTMTFTFLYVPTDALNTYVQHT